MTVTLEKETYHFFNVSELRLRYASCRATENSTHFIISTSLNDCGTFVNETEHVLIFWNEVQADALVIDNVITRTHDVKLPFSCRYSRKSLLSLGFTPQSIYFGQEGNAKLSFVVNIRSVIIPKDVVLIEGFGKRVYILVATQIRSCDYSFGRLQLLCFYILLCNQLCVTNCTIVTSQCKWIITLSELGGNKCVNMLAEFVYPAEVCLISDKLCLSVKSITLAL